MVFMRFTSEKVCFQEVPGEIALAYTISGCQVGCKGCHSAETWSPTAGRELTPAYYAQRLSEYRKLISCVLFLGGEWHPQDLRARLMAARQHGLHTCLYTGLEDVSSDLKECLTFLKTGPWISRLGGLNVPTTNQRMYDLRTGVCINHLFQANSSNLEATIPIKTE